MPSLVLKDIKKNQSETRRSIENINRNINQCLELKPV